MSFQAAEPTAHSNHTNWTGMAQGTLKAEVSKSKAWGPESARQRVQSGPLDDFTNCEGGLKFLGF